MTECLPPRSGEKKECRLSAQVKKLVKLRVVCLDAFCLLNQSVATLCNLLRDVGALGLST